MMILKVDKCTRDADIYKDIPEEDKDAYMEFENLVLGAIIDKMDARDAERKTNTE